MTAKPVAAGGDDGKAGSGTGGDEGGSGSAKCKDGKTVTYAHRSGTCSGHGGVASWL